MYKYNEELSETIQVLVSSLYLKRKLYNLIETLILANMQEILKETPACFYEACVAGAGAGSCHCVRHDALWSLGL